MNTREYAWSDFFALLVNWLLLCVGFPLYWRVAHHEWIYRDMVRSADGWILFGLFLLLAAGVQLVLRQLRRLHAKLRDHFDA